ncbi:MAG: ABC transporter substrate-binding protein [Candidatus Thorarchaeota archaeon]
MSKISLLSAKRIALVLFLILMFGSPLLVQSQTEISFSTNGPYIEKIAFHIMNNHVIGLLDDEIDMTYGKLRINEFEALYEAENIETSISLRNGYGVLVINCDKYPYNITSFRRALAFAIDKEAISDDVYNGLSQAQDSVIPCVSPWSIEGQLPYTYYESNVELGKALLDAAGFLDVDDDGFREAPDSSDFQVTVECAHISEIATQIGDLTRDALNALGIDAVSVPTDFYEYLKRMDYHGDFDIIFLGLEFGRYLDCDWMAYSFHSKYADTPYLNPSNFRNETADYWADKLINSITYDDVYEASAELQKILIYECPRIVCYENFFLNAYRIDRFEDFIDLQGDNWWTYFQVKLKEVFGGPFGGTIRCGTRAFYTFNHMTATTTYAWEILSELYDSLLRTDPNGNDLNWLCESYTMLTNDDNPHVPPGYTRIAFDIVQNATWTDGIPLTGEDVAFSLNYYRNLKGNPFGVDLVDMTAAYTPSPYKVIVEFSSESYWHLDSVAYKPIIPKHVFKDIGIEGWNTWNPHPPVDEMVTSGPFNVSEHIDGEFTELTRFDNYFRGLDYDNTGEEPEPTSPPDLIPALVVGTISAAVTIAFGGYIITKKNWGNDVTVT